MTLVGLSCLWAESSVTSWCVFPNCLTALRASIHAPSRVRVSLNLVPMPLARDSSSRTCGRRCRIGLATQPASRIPTSLAWAVQRRLDLVAPRDWFWDILPVQSVRSPERVSTVVRRPVWRRGVKRGLQNKFVPPWLPCGFLLAGLSGGGRGLASGTARGEFSSGRQAEFHELVSGIHGGPGRTRTCNQTVMSGRL